MGCKTESQKLSSDSPTTFRHHLALWSQNSWWYIGSDLQHLGVDWRVSHSRHGYLGGQRVECPCVYTSGLTWTFLFLHTMLHLSRLLYMHYASICCTVMLLLRNFNMIFDSTSRASVRITKTSLPELTDGSINTHKVVCCYGSRLLLWTHSTWLIYGVPCSFTPFWPSLLDCYVALYYFSQVCKWHNPIDYYGNQLGKRDLLMTSHGTASNYGTMENAHQELSHPGWPRLMSSSISPLIISHGRCYQTLSSTVTLAMSLTGTSHTLTTRANMNTLCQETGHGHKQWVDCLLGLLIWLLYVSTGWDLTGCMHTRCNIHSYYLR